MFRIKRNKPDKVSPVADGVTRVKVSGVVNVFFIDVVFPTLSSSSSPISPAASVDPSYIPPPPVSSVPPPPVVSPSAINPEIPPNVPPVPSNPVDPVLPIRPEWVLVDTGMPNSADPIMYAAEQRYGVNVPPRCIILTHGHVDHAGSAKELAERWRVPVYAHPLELPYLTGRSDYPPRDPSIGGTMSAVSRLFPSQSCCNLGHLVHPLPTLLPPSAEVPSRQEVPGVVTPGGDVVPPPPPPPPIASPVASPSGIPPPPVEPPLNSTRGDNEDPNFPAGYSVSPLRIGDRGELAELPGWQILHVPGHTAGSIALWRPSDRTLLVGDAFLTQPQDNPLAVLLERRAFDRPPVYWTTDWPRARESIQFMATLEPNAIGSGHGAPIGANSVRRIRRAGRVGGEAEEENVVVGVGVGAGAANEFRQFAQSVEGPRRGRYAATPAVADESGVVSVPPPPADGRRPGWLLAVLGGVAVAGSTVASWVL